MSLRDRIDNPDRRRADDPPDEEHRRQAERRIPEWRRRAAERVAEVGFVAVTDLTRDAA